MNTLDLRELIAEKSLTLTQARDKVRQRIKSGELWSRLNPDLLSDAELMPYMSVNNPPASAAELVPFPIPAQKFRDFDIDEDIFQFMAEERIRWSNRSGRRITEAYRKRIEHLMFYYDPILPAMGRDYYWMDFDHTNCPIRPMLNTIFPALNNYALANPVLPKPPVAEPGEAWYTKDSDDYGVSLHFSATAEKEEVIMAASLSAEKTFWNANYRLNSDRYAFIRQQIFYLLGDRLEPWLEGDVLSCGYFRGMVYRKPKS